MNKCILQTVDIVKICPTKFSANYLYHTHSHHHYEIIYVLSGQCVLSVMDNEVALNVGDCIVINRDKKHTFFVNGANGCKINQLEVGFDELTLFSQDFLKVANAKDIDNAINNILTYTNTLKYKQVCDQLLRLELEKISIIISCYSDGEDVFKNYHLHRAIEEIKNSYCEDIKLTDIASRINISDRYLRRIFADFIGVTPLNYIAYLRIEKAKKLLLFSALPISEIATKVGYNTIQYFSEIFKHHTGITPSEFKRNNLQSSMK